MPRDLAVPSCLFPILDQLATMYMLQIHSVLSRLVITDRWNDSSAHCIHRFHRRSFWVLPAWMCCFLSTWLERGWCSVYVLEWSMHAWRWHACALYSQSWRNLACEHCGGVVKWGLCRSGAPRGLHAIRSHTRRCPCSPPPSFRVGCTGNPLGFLGDPLWFLAIPLGFQGGVLNATLAGVLGKCNPVACWY